MNSQLYSLHSVTGVIPMVGGRSQLYFELTTRVSSPSTLYVAFILVQGRQAWKLDIRHSSSFRPSEIWNLLVARASSFFSLSLVVTDRCGTSDPKLGGTFIYNVTGCIPVLRLLTATVSLTFSSYLSPRLSFVYLCWLFSLYTICCQEERTVITLYEKYRLVIQYTQQHRFLLFF